ncbi:ribosome maturation protein RimM [Weissella oryzae SG25]|uniref:Ribosome maturation factor RimM n=1 Tax=Weissella oryzae (strain DSM 25784 / JCM 18191 / LMG 30913 / SG25) TaxID=1329250 RepID=A0A069CV90_WEIOS|nr:ribosome maturation factor RimM [Weissella oryzae]GAK31715.1 ribosome maturation protein RimM [Weissella oryzae SG25]
MALYKVGTIVNTHGIRGEVRVIATTDFPEERFVKGQTLVIDGKVPVEVTIQTVRAHKQFILLSFKDLQNINLVEQYKGRDLLVDGETLSDLADNEYYYHEIIGLQVIDNATDEKIGEVSEILELPANDVWVVKRAGKDDLYLPYIADVVTAIDLDSGTAQINLLEGLE